MSIWKWTINKLILIIFIKRIINNYLKKGNSFNNNNSNNCKNINNDLCKKKEYLIYFVYL